MLVYPCRLVEILETLHLTQRFGEFNHIVGKLCAITFAAATVVEVCLAVIVNEYGGVDERESAHILHRLVEGLEVTVGILAGGNTDFPCIVPVAAAGMGEVEIISTVLICTVGSPHETALRTTPCHILRTEYLAVVGPVDHIVGREYMILVHQVATSWRVNVM